MNRTAYIYPLRKQCGLCGREYPWDAKQAYCECEARGFLYSIVGMNEQQGTRRTGEQRQIRKSSNWQQGRR
ncbi:MAG: hypothetical protein J6B85_02695 [Lachnospiraceae bacterium]|nr:hypothetical protein [Lachnospiraceae bacterium]